MDRNVSSFTVLFQPPFWVGIAQRWDSGGYRAARVVFGAQPTDAQIYQWVQQHWHKLRFSPADQDATLKPPHKNPKRLQREARDAAATGGVGTRAQQALSRQREQEGQLRQTRNRERRREEEERKFLLRQQKKREKKRGS